MNGDRTERLVHNQPRRVETPRQPILPKPTGWLRQVLWAPLICLAGVVFIVGAAVAILGVGICMVSDFCLEWLYGGRDPWI